MKKTAKDCISIGSVHIKFQQYIKDYHVSFKDVLSCALLLSHVWFFVTPWAVSVQAPLSMGILQARILEWFAMTSSRGSSQPRDWTQVSHIVDGFFTVWATGKSMNIGVGSLFLLQGIFPTQESNGALLHCRQILYPLSHQEGPSFQDINV